MGTGTILEARPDMPPAWSPDSRSIAYPAWSVGEELGIYVASVDTGKVRNVAPTENSSGFAAWSPDGAWVAYREVFGGRTRVTIVRPDGTGRQELASAPGDVDAFTQVAWAPDSSALAYHRPSDDAGGKSAIYIYDLANGERQLSRPGQVAYSPTWSTDGTRLAYYEEIADGTEAFHYDLVISTVHGEQHPLGRLGDCVALWSPDSRYLISYANGCFTDQLVVITVADGSVRTIPLPGKIAGAPSWQRVADP
jgi:Tol biopolymer transport system component